MKKLIALLSSLAVAASVYSQSITLDSEWNTAAKINTATTDQDFIVQDGSVAMTGSLVSDLDTGLTAGTTQTQGGGLALTAQINDITTVANANDAVVLAGFTKGSKQTVYNNGANILQVFPASGDDLGAGLNTSTTVDVGQVLIATGVDTTNANTVISVPTPVIQKHATSHTLSAHECYGGSVYYITASGVTLTLPAAEDGMSITVICTTANVGIVDSNASDLIILDGTALDDGDSIDSPGAAGDIVVLTYYDATGWFASSNTWVDGGAS